MGTERNEAADRLRDLKRFAGWDDLVDEALAAERRATVERIRAELADASEGNDWVTLEDVRAVLDELLA